jgi:hypothetical protein
MSLIALWVCRSGDAAQVPIAATTKLWNQTVQTLIPRQSGKGPGMISHHSAVLEAVLAIGALLGQNIPTR